MKTKIKFTIALIFFSSCGDVAIKFPQPTYLENIEKIPNKFHGSFERIDDKEDTIKYKIFESFALIDNDTLKLSSEDLIVKYQNNNLFVNLKNDDYYNLYVLSRFNYFNSDSIQIKTFSFNDAPAHHYTKKNGETDIPSIIKYMLNNKFSYVESIIDTTLESNFDVFSDTLNSNQINTLLNWDGYAYRLKFEKHQINSAFLE